MNDTHKKLYGDVYFKSQLRKFHDRKENHWAPRIRKVFDLISGIEPPGRRVLDLGTSIGTFAFEFAERGYETVGIDLSEDAIFVADELAKNSRINITYVIGDVSDRKVFKEEEFDLIYAGDIIEHLMEGDLLRTMENCYSWLKAGGFFVFHTVPTRYNVIFHKTRLWILLVPFSIFPDRFFKKTVEMLFGLFNRSLKALTGRSYVERERETVHCNLQTREGFSEVLRKSDFGILHLELITTEDRFLKGAKKYFFKNKEYFQKEIFGIAQKPSGTGSMPE